MSNDVKDAAAPTAKKQRGANLAPYCFKPGQSGNPNGRKKGSRNKLGEEFLDALQADFEAHGAEVIVRVREDRPHEYLKVIAGILPKELNVNTRAVEEMSDDDLAAGIAALQSVLAAQAAREGAGPATVN